MAKIIDNIDKWEEDFEENKKAPWADSAENIHWNTYTYEKETLVKDAASVDVFPLSTDDSNNYYFDTEETSKTLIVLHFTKGSKVTGSIGNLSRNNKKVSVAYIITRKGIIFRFFDDGYYARAIGSTNRGTSLLIDKRAVQIEIINEGPLKIRNGSELWAINKEGAYKSDGHYCNLDDTDYYVKLDENWRGQKYYATYTKSQYDSIKKLLKYITNQHNIDWYFVPLKKRFKPFKNSKEGNSYKGIASHINYRANTNFSAGPIKFDIGPAFPWHLLVMDFAFPINIKESNGIEVTLENINAYFAHTEKNIAGGYYPLGANTVWHGGLHIHAQRGEKVFACAAGDIVAARLPSKEAQAYGEWGSHNFILMRHEYSNWSASDTKVYYSLYMHLNTEEFTEDNENIKEVTWFRSVKDNYRVKEDTDMLWLPSPGKIGTFICGLEVTKIGEEGDYTMVKFMQNNPKVTWDDDSIDRSTTILRRAYVKTSALELFDPRDEWIEKWEKNKIVSLDIPIEAGEQIWTVGQYGDWRCRSEMIHWEIFSEENIFPGWKEVEDDKGAADDDFNMDHKEILKMIEQEEGWLEDDEVLTFDEIKKFYDSDKSNKLRKYVCKFVSEWGVNIEKAVDNMHDRFFTFFLKEELKPYVWWDDAAAAGVPLTSTKKVYHYNPIQFLSKMCEIGNKSVR